MNKSASKPIEESVKNSLTNLAIQSPKVLLGVSGGPDSMALLYALFRQKTDTFVVHINYGLRGSESDLDQELVEGMATEWGFDCCSVRLDIDKKAGNFQNRAREERYRIFRELKTDINADAILTAHHKDDQVETILQKLFRGSGSVAWQGLKVWDGELLRPLLIHTKKEILNYCEEEAIPYRIDQSNLKPVYARNFLRNEFSDSLDEFFPGWQENILGLAEKGRITELALDHIYETVSDKEGISLSAFQKVDTRLKPAILKKFVETKIPNLRLSKGMVAELAKIESLQTGGAIEVNEKFSLVKGRSTLSIMVREDSVPREVIILKEEAEDGIKFDHLNVSIKTNAESESALHIDSDLLSWPLKLRTWKPGDRFRPLGMNGSQKVSDHLTNRKIPSIKKEKALILSGVDSTIYAIIFPEKAANGETGTISEHAKCTDSTKKYLTIQLK